MRISTAYFAGVGTVIMAVGAGLGGGYLAANIDPPADADGLQAGTQDVGGTDNRLDGTSGAGAAGGCGGPDEARCRARPGADPATAATAAAATQPQPQIEAAAPSANPARAEEKPTNNVAAAQPVQPPPQPSKPAEQADEKTAGPREVYARASDADVKRADAEKRRAERRQQWTDKRRLKQPREQESLETAP